MSHCRSFEALREVVRRLLGPDGCPWDKEQTPESLCDYVIEEAFELVEAIRAGSWQEAREEVGDVAFLLVFIAELYAAQGRFTMDDALDEAAAKMIRRHPHVFAEESIESFDELFRNWERIKRDEKRDEETGKAAGVFASLPGGLPPLLRAYRINAKAARTGFTWESDESADAQLASEWDEWREASESGDQERMTEEFGDLLFTLVETGRRKGIKANAALDAANRKFLARFAAMEALAEARGLDFHALSLDEKNALWDEVKLARS